MEGGEGGGVEGLGLARGGIVMFLWWVWLMRYGMSRCSYMVKWLEVIILEVCEWKLLIFSSMVMYVMLIGSSECDLQKAVL